MRSAVDHDTTVQVDILFAGDDRDMIVPLPDPVEVLEYDSHLGANFPSLPAILELLKNNQESLSLELFAGSHPRVRKELVRIRKKLNRGSRQPS